MNFKALPASISFSLTRGGDGVSIGFVPEESAEEWACIVNFGADCFIFIFSVLQDWPYLINKLNFKAVLDYISSSFTRGGDGVSFGLVIKALAEEWACVVNFVWLIVNFLFFVCVVRLAISQPKN